MPDTTTTPEHHPFDPEGPKRLRAFLAAVPKHAITIAIRPGATLRRPDLEQLLERDEWSDEARLSLADSCASLRSQRDEALCDRDAMRWNYEHACKTIADLKARCLAAEEALEIALKRKDG